MGNPLIVVNTFSPGEYTDSSGTHFSPTGHTDVDFYDENGNFIGRYGANIGESDLPGEFGGVYKEDPSRQADYGQTIVFTDVSAWANALNFALNAANMTAGGAGEYLLIGNNCYDFVDNVLQQSGFPADVAYSFMLPGTPVYDYGLVEGMLNQSMNVFDPAYWDDNFASEVGDWIIQAWNFITETGGDDAVDLSQIFYTLDGLVKNSYISPLAIDLNGDGITVIPLSESKASFDFLGDGQPLKTSWLNPADGFLVVDKNENSKIDGLDEMFGGYSTGSAFSKLTKLDDNHDGLIDKADKIWDTLRIWIDQNSDGKSDASELHKLSDLGIDSVGLDVYQTSIHLVDGYINQMASVSMNGSSVQIADVFFHQAGVAS